MVSRNPYLDDSSDSESERKDLKTPPAPMSTENLEDYNSATINDILGVPQTQSTIVPNITDYFSETSGMQISMDDLLKQIGIVNIPTQHHESITQNSQIITKLEHGTKNEFDVQSVATNSSEERRSIVDNDHKEELINQQLMQEVTEEAKDKKKEEENINKEKEEIEDEENVIEPTENKDRESDEDGIFCFPQLDN